MKVMIISLLFCSIHVLTLSGQEIPQSITPKLGRASINFLKPTDTDFKWIKPSKYAKEDLRFISRGVEVLLFIYEPEDSEINFPHIKFNNLLHHLATNTEDELIYIYSLPDNPDLDYQSEARFIIKEKVSKSKKYALAKAGFLSAKGMYIVIYLSDKLTPDFPSYFEFQNDSDGNP